MWIHVLSVEKGSGSMQAYHVTFQNTVTCIDIANGRVRIITEVRVLSSDYSVANGASVLFHINDQPFFRCKTNEIGFAVADIFVPIDQVSPANVNKISVHIDEAYWDSKSFGLINNSQITGLAYTHRPDFSDPVEFYDRYGSANKSWEEGVQFAVILSEADFQNVSAIPIAASLVSETITEDLGTVVSKHEGSACFHFESFVHLNVTRGKKDTYSERNFSPEKIKTFHIHVYIPDVFKEPIIKHSLDCKMEYVRYS